MIRQGIITFPDRLFGYADNATQEEAERLSGGWAQAGVIVFVPFINGSTQSDVDVHIARQEDVGI